MNELILAGLLLVAPPPPVEADLLGPGCDLARLAKLLEPHKARRSVLLVGHEPDLGKLAGTLVFGAPAPLPFKKAGACAVESSCWPWPSSA